MLRTLKCCLCLVPLLLVVLIAGCKSGSGLPASEGRIAGTINIYGPLPEYSLNTFTLGLFPNNSLDYDNIISKIILGTVSTTADAEGKRTYEFGFSGVAAGDYQVLLFQHYEIDWGIYENNIFWASDMISINSGQPSKTELVLNASCMGDGPYGVVSGYLRASGNPKEADYAITILEIEDYDYWKWGIELDRWNRGKFNIPHIQIGRYKCTYEFDVIENSELNLGSLYFGCNPYDGNILGEAVFSDIKLFNRDIVVYAERRGQSSSKHQSAFYFIQPQLVLPGDPVKFSLSSLTQGIYDITVLSLGDSEDDVIEIAKYANPVRIDELNYDKNIQIGDIAIDDSFATGVPPVTGRIAGEIKISGSVPRTRISNYGYLSELVLGLFLGGNTSRAGLARAFEIGDVLAEPVGSEHVYTFPFEFTGVIPTQYQIGIVSAIELAEETDYIQTYWESAIISLPRDQPDIEGLHLQANCFGEPPYGTISGRVLVSSRPLEHRQGQILLRRSNSGFYAWQPVYDRWNRAQFLVEQVPEEKYELDFYMYETEWESDTWPATVIGNEDTYVGDHYLSYRTPVENFITGSVKFQQDDYPGRDLLVVVQLTPGFDPDYQLSRDEIRFRHVSPAETSIEQPLSFEFTGYWIGEYVVELLSIGVSEDDVVVLARGEEPIVVEDAWAPQLHDVGTLVAVD